MKNEELYPEANDLNMDRWSTILANADGKGTARTRKRCSCTTFEG